MSDRKAIYNPEADARWRDKNRERVNYMRARRGAKSFILTKATSEDLQEIEGFIEERKKYLEKNEKKV